MISARYAANRATMKIRSLDNAGKFYLVTSGALWLGALRIIGALGNATIGGEPQLESSFGITILLFVSYCVAVSLALFLVRRLIFAQLMFAASCTFADAYIYFSLSAGLNCKYWHQGDVFCARLDAPLIAYTIPYLMLVVGCAGIFVMRLFGKRPKNWATVFAFIGLFIFSAIAIVAAELAM